MIAKNNRLTIILAIAGLILLLPLVAMQFTNEVKWSISDFIIAGCLLFGTGAAIEFTLRKIKQLNYQVLAVAAILLVLLLIWAELAVGILPNVGRLTL
ncbi:MAG: hypothetical protein ACK4NY_13945 [Spirosomataceae bacterium]